MNSIHLQSAFQTGATFVSEKRYHIEFDGKIIPGWGFEEVKANLAKLLKANEEKLYQLFSGRRFIIKKNVDYQTAIKINNVLKDAGADCIISPAPNSDTAVPPPLPSQSKPSRTDQRPSAAAKPLPVPTQKVLVCRCYPAFFSPNNCRGKKHLQCIHFVLFRRNPVDGAGRNNHSSRRTGHLFYLL